MTTDTERREVARRLREYVDLPDDWWQETCAEFYVEKCVFGNVDRHSEAELFTRLADLIDPDCEEGRYSVARTARPVDRDALMALADELSGDTLDVPAVYGTYMGGYVAACRDVALRIREALGESDG